MTSTFLRIALLQSRKVSTNSVPNLLLQSACVPQQRDASEVPHDHMRQLQASLQKIVCIFCPKMGLKDGHIEIY
jgi:hypothetical protein